MISRRSRPRTSPHARSDIRTVARRAAVSISTVSRFLNGKKRVSSQTEQRILAAVKAVGYAPNRVARSLRLSRTNTMGLLIPDASNPFFSGLVKGAEDAARAAGLALILFDTNEDRAQEQAHLGTLVSLRCDGVLLIAAPTGPDEPERWRNFDRFPLPVVVVDRAVPLPTDTVVADNASGGYEATSHLVGLGHRRIGIIGPDYDVASQRDRRAGYMRALAEAHVAHEPGYDVRVPLTVDGGFSGASKLLDLPEPPTAFFATSNALAIGAVAALKARGLRCPGDVSVIGYDSYEWQEVFQPRLSTVKQPSYLMGQRATELLIERITGKKKGPAEKVVLRSSLVLRDSCDVLRERHA